MYLLNAKIGWIIIHKILFLLLLFFFIIYHIKKIIPVLIQYIDKESLSLSLSFYLSFFISLSLPVFSLFLFFINFQYFICFIYFNKTEISNCVNKYFVIFFNLNEISKFSQNKKKSKRKKKKIYKYLIKFIVSLYFKCMSIFTRIK